MVENDGSAQIEPRKIRAEGDNRRCRGQLHEDEVVRYRLGQVATGGAMFMGTRRIVRRRDFSGESQLFVAMIVCGALRFMIMSKMRRRMGVSMIVPEFHEQAVGQMEQSREENDDFETLAVHCRPDEKADFSAGLHSRQTDARCQLQLSCILRSPPRRCSPGEPFFMMTPIAPEVSPIKPPAQRKI